MDDSLTGIQPDICLMFAGFVGRVYFMMAKMLGNGYSRSI
jgi:hypothetical protein